MKLIPAASVFFVTMLILGLSAEDTFQGNPIKRPFDSSHSAAKPSSTQILFHGGPVMNVANSVYVIYYGTFPSTTQPIINDFLAGLSGSPAFGVNSSYNGSTQSPAPVPADYAFVSPGPAPAKNPSTSVYLDNYSQGMQLSNSSVPKIVAHAIAAGLTANQNGVYLVITAPDVKISGFCNSFCAYHTTSTSIVSGMHIRFALIPDPTQRCTGCNGSIAVYHDSVTPNGDMGADTMTDDIIHELSETVTDPDISAWYTQSGAEDADLCNYVYETPGSPIMSATNAAGATYHYNVTLSGRPFLVQFIWKNSGAGFCSKN